MASLCHDNHSVLMVVVLVNIDKDHNLKDYLGSHNVHVSVYASLFLMLDAENFLTGFCNT